MFLYVRVFHILLIAIFVQTTLLLEAINPPEAYAQQMLLPKPVVGQFKPSVQLQGMRFDVKNPYDIEFIINQAQGVKEGELKRIADYFLAVLTTPQEDLWVNLSPYERDRIIPSFLSNTDLGKEFMEQDLQLKKQASLLTHPDSALGKEFWSKVYARSQAQLGTTNVSVSNYHKVWIVPNQAQVYKVGSTVMVGQATLKVMLERDYLAYQRQQANGFVGGGQSRVSPAQEHDSQAIFKSVIIPELEKLVNEDKAFAGLRQVYHVVILATWFKSQSAGLILNKVYANQRKIKGLELSDATIKERLYQQYLHYYKKGAYNLIKEEPQGASALVARKYFSGGLTFGQNLKVQEKAMVSMAQLRQGLSAISSTLAKFTVRLSPIVATAAIMLATPNTALAKSDLVHKPTRIERKVSPFDVKGGQLLNKGLSSSRVKKAVQSPREDVLKPSLPKSENEIKAPEVSTSNDFFKKPILSPSGNGKTQIEESNLNDPNQDGLKQKDEIKDKQIEREVNPEKTAEKQSGVSANDDNNDAYDVTPPVESSPATVKQEVSQPAVPVASKPADSKGLQLSAYGQVGYGLGQHGGVTYQHDVRVGNEFKNNVTIYGGVNVEKSPVSMVGTMGEPVSDPMVGVSSNEQNSVMVAPYVGAHKIFNAGFVGNIDGYVEVMDKNFMAGLATLPKYNKGLSSYSEVDVFGYKAPLDYHGGALLKWYLSGPISLLTSSDAQWQKDTYVSLTLEVVTLPQEAQMFDGGGNLRISYKWWDLSFGLNTFRSISGIDALGHGDGVDRYGRGFVRLGLRASDRLNFFVAAVETYKKDDPVIFVGAEYALGRPRSIHSTPKAFVPPNFLEAAVNASKRLLGGSSGAGGNPPDKDDRAMTAQLSRRVFLKTTAVLSTSTLLGQSKGIPSPQAAVGLPVSLKELFEGVNGADPDGDPVCGLGTFNLRIDDLIVPSHWVYFAFMYWYITNAHVANIDFGKDDSRIQALKDKFANYSPMDWEKIFKAERFSPDMKEMVELVQAKMQAHALMFVSNLDELAGKKILYLRRDNHRNIFTRGQLKNPNDHGDFLGDDFRAWLNSWVVYLRFHQLDVSHDATLQSIKELKRIRVRFLKEFLLPEDLLAIQPTYHRFSAEQTSLIQQLIQNPNPAKRQDLLDKLSDFIIIKAVEYKLQKAGLYSGEIDPDNEEFDRLVSRLLSLLLRTVSSDHVIKAFSIRKAQLPESLKREIQGNLKNYLKANPGWLLLAAQVAFEFERIRGFVSQQFLERLKQELDGNKAMVASGKSTGGIDFRLPLTTSRVSNNNFARDVLGFNVSIIDIKSVYVLGD